MHTQLRLPSGQACALLRVHASRLSLSLSLSLSRVPCCVCKRQGVRHAGWLRVQKNNLPRLKHARRLRVQA